MAERGYGWEKLVSEMFCQEYWHERGMKTAIARFHNVYGPHGTWDGGREKAPAALCRKVIEAIDTGSKDITIWGDGQQTRSFMYIDDCVKGIDMITHCDDLIATPINLGSSELVSINELLTKIEKIAGVKMNRQYDLDAPQGVAGRNSDNTFIKKVLDWEPKTTLDKGLAETYEWIDRTIQKAQGRQTRRASADERKRLRPSPSCSAPFPTACNWRAVGLTSRSSRGTTRSRPARWWWCRSSRISARWTAPASPAARAPSP